MKIFLLDNPVVHKRKFSENRNSTPPPIVVNNFRKSKHLNLEWTSFLGLSRYQFRKLFILAERQNPKRWQRKKDRHITLPQISSLLTSTCERSRNHWTPKNDTRIKHYESPYQAHKNQISTVLETSVWLLWQINIIWSQWKYDHSV